MIDHKKPRLGKTARRQAKREHMDPAKPGHFPPLGVGTAPMPELEPEPAPAPKPKRVIVDPAPKPAKRQPPKKKAKKA